MNAIVKTSATERNLANVITSLEVAGMIEKQHNELLKDIRRFIELLGEGDFPHTDFLRNLLMLQSKTKLNLVIL